MAEQVAAHQSVERIDHGRHIFGRDRPVELRNRRCARGGADLVRSDRFRLSGPDRAGQPASKCLRVAGPPTPCRWPAPRMPGAGPGGRSVRSTAFRWRSRDVFDVAGLPTRGGSRSSSSEPASTSAVSVRRLQDAGMIVLGKTAMVELGLGGWGTQSASPVPWNPWDHAEHRVPGGSSSGSAVAVAAGLAPVALGSDFGGSARIPAAFCGVVGFKPSPGRVPMDGAIPVSRTHDTFGVLGRTVEDVRLIFDAVLEGSGIFVGTSGGSNDLLIGAPRRRPARHRDTGGADALSRCPGQAPRRCLPRRSLCRPRDVRDLFGLGRRAGAAPGLRALRQRRRGGTGALLRHGARADPQRSGDARPRGRHRRSATASGTLHDGDARVRPDRRADLSGRRHPRCPRSTRRCRRASLPRFANYLDLPALSIPIGVTSEGMPVGLQFAGAPQRADALLLDFGEAAAGKLEFPPSRLAWGLRAVTS